MDNKALLQEVEQYLLRNGRIYFNGWTYNKATLAEFYLDIDPLQKLYFTHPEYVDAYDITDTYHRRSFRDQFLLCNYYFNCTLEEFINTIKQYGVVGDYCHEVALWMLKPQCKNPAYRLVDADRPLEELYNHTINELLNAA